MNVFYLSDLSWSGSCICSCLASCCSSSSVMVCGGGVDRDRSASALLLSWFPSVASLASASAGFESILGVTEVQDAEWTLKPTDWVGEGTVERVDTESWPKFRKK